MLDMAGFAEPGTPVLTHPTTRRWDQFMDLKDAGASRFSVARTGKPTVSLGDKVRMFDVAPPGADATTDAGVLFGTAIPSGMITEVLGEVLDLVINSSQIGTNDTARVGAILRLDSRTAQKRYSLFAVNSGVTAEWMSLKFDTGMVGIGLNLSQLAMFHVASYLATTITAIFQGYASQSANLTEWRNSSATVLTKVDKDGYFTLPGGLRLLGYLTSVLAPTTSDLPTSKDCAIHKDTALGTVRLAFNDGGTIRSVVLA